MDDSLDWRGITLPDDPLKSFGKEGDIPVLSKIGVLGIYRLNQWNTSKNAYKRTHVTAWKAHTV